MSLNEGSNITAHRSNSEFRVSSPSPAGTHPKRYSRIPIVAAPPSMAPMKSTPGNFGNHYLIFTIDTIPTITARKPEAMSKSVRNGVTVKASTTLSNSSNNSDCKRNKLSWNDERFGFIWLGSTRALVIL